MREHVLRRLVPLLFAGLAGALPLDAAAVTIHVFPSLAPNPWLSPASFAGYEANALSALEHGLPAYGDASLPTYYERVSVLTPAGGLLTDFPSWRGRAAPAGPFAAEFGNLMLFGVHVLGGGETFSISELSFVAASSDEANALAVSYPTGAYDYSGGYVGIDYGSDRVKGTEDDAYVTGGPPDRLVDELVGRGSGTGLEVYSTDFGGTDQDKIDALASYFADRATFTGTYALRGETGTAAFEMRPVPEPGTVALLGGGLGALAAAARRRKERSRL